LSCNEHATSFQLFGILFWVFAAKDNQEHAMDITMCVMDVTNAAPWL
jgi:hypothetical protein